MFSSFYILIGKLIYYSIVVTILPVLHFQRPVIWYSILFITISSNPRNIIKLDSFDVENSISANKLSNFISLKNSPYLLIRKTFHSISLFENIKIYKRNNFYNVFKILKLNTDVIRTIFSIIVVWNLSELLYGPAV